MSTSEMQKGRSITVTYTYEQTLSQDEVRELIQATAPSGFQVQNVELQDKQIDS